MRTVGFVTKSVVVSLVLLAGTSITNLGMAVDRPVVAAPGQLCRSLEDPGSTLSMFIADIWPGLHGPNDVLEDTTAGPPGDPFAPSAAARMAAHLEPPPMTEATGIWKQRWGPRKQPSASVIRSWLAAQREQPLQCGASDLKRWQIALVSPKEGSAVISRWTLDPRKALSVIVIGTPGFNKARTEALLEYSTSKPGPGLSGQDVIIFFTKRAGHWRETGRILVSVS